ncbi:2-amino-4-hydroxy-6-hydroxymethyldihydropteridine diphosphokinase [Candidatus Peregrinibacteria bacterium]|nr:MAG: 2-amino-4-hydroxy-6-hydroxymethyldihydropteridine diphosphokinase [Candidatus Peregrinibacteria bacterium]
MNSTTCYLSLGSNIEDRMAHMEDALSMLAKDELIELVKTSKIYETEPWPLEDHPKKEAGQSWFLNQVIQIKTALDPHELLVVLQHIERTLGRITKDHWGPRTVDLDLLLYGDQVIESSELTVPHRHMNDREFVLIPLLEIAPDLVDPVSGERYDFLLKQIQNGPTVKAYSFIL